MLKPEREEHRLVYPLAHELDAEAQVLDVIGAIGHLQVEGAGVFGVGRVLRAVRVHLSDGYVEGDGLFVAGVVAGARG